MGAQPAWAAAAVVPQRRIDLTHFRLDTAVTSDRGLRLFPGFACGAAFYLVV